LIGYRCGSWNKIGRLVFPRFFLVAWLGFNIANFEYFQSEIDNNTILVASRAVQDRRQKKKLQVNLMIFIAYWKNIMHGYYYLNLSIFYTLMATFLKDDSDQALG
jgi:hypothetical protein